MGLLQDRNVHFPSRQDQDLYPGIIWLNPLSRSSDKEKDNFKAFASAFRAIDEIKQIPRNMGDREQLYIYVLYLF